MGGLTKNLKGEGGGEGVILPGNFWVKQKKNYLEVRLGLRQKKRGKKHPLPLDDPVFLGGSKL